MARVQPSVVGPKFASARTVEMALWSSIGDVDVAEGGVYEVLLGGNILTVVANLTAALSGDTKVNVSLNGHLLWPLRIPSGSTRATVTLDEATNPQDLLSIESVQVGSGSALATVQMMISG